MDKFIEHGNKADIWRAVSLVLRKKNCKNIFVERILTFSRIYRCIYFLAKCMATKLANMAEFLIREVGFYYVKCWQSLQRPGSLYLKSLLMFVVLFWDSTCFVIIFNNILTIKVFLQFFSRPVLWFAQVRLWTCQWVLQRSNISWKHNCKQV